MFVEFLIFIRITAHGPELNVGIGFALFIALEMRGKIKRDQRVGCPIQQSHWQAMMTRNDDRFPRSRNAAQEFIGAAAKAAQQLPFIFLSKAMEFTQVPIAAADGRLRLRCAAGLSRFCPEIRAWLPA